MLFPLLTEAGKGRTPVIPGGALIPKMAVLSQFCLTAGHFCPDWTPITIPGLSADSKLVRVASSTGKRANKRTSWNTVFERTDVVAGELIFFSCLHLRRSLFDKVTSGKMIPSTLGKFYPPTTPSKQNHQAVLLNLPGTGSFL